MIGRLFATALLAWAAGFALFVVTLPHPAPADSETDGIVVLTGGTGRLERGAALLGEGHARRLLVSGADRRVRLRDLSRLYHLSPAVAARIDLGHAAVDTRSNAAETEQWIRAHGYRSIRLVTTDWHMPRARFELSRLIGRTALLPDAVPSEPGLRTLVTEYNKYLLRRGAALAGQ